MYAKTPEKKAQYLGGLVNIVFLVDLPCISYVFLVYSLDMLRQTYFSPTPTSQLMSQFSRITSMRKFQKAISAAKRLETS